MQNNIKYELQINLYNGYIHHYVTLSLLLLQSLFHSMVIESTNLSVNWDI